MLLCIGAINSNLINLGLRGYVSINVQTGETLDTHSFATMIGMGATTVNPYLALDPSRSLEQGSVVLKE